MENKPLISIITIVYNGEEFLEETILSVVNQSYENIEYIIIDGGSTDGTVDIIKRYEDKIAYWISEPDRGVSDAFNKGLAVARGDYIEMLNCGDYFLEDNLAILVEKYFHSEAVISFQAKTDTGNVFPKIFRKKSEINPTKINEALLNAMVSHQATFVSKEVYEEIGLYSLDFKLRMDFDLFLRIQKKYEITFIELPIILYRTDGISSDIKNRVQFKLEELSIVCKNYPVECSRLYRVGFFFKLPLYLLKKLLSHFYYKYFKK